VLGDNVEQVEGQLVGHVGDVDGARRRAGAAQDLEEHLLVELLLALVQLGGPLVVVAPAPAQVELGARRAHAQLRVARLSDAVKNHSSLKIPLETLNG